MGMTMTIDWRFDDPPNAASFTTIFVLDGSPILRVYHDYDGGWQFHGSVDHQATADVCRLVSLGSMIDRDSSLAVLHDLPCGWRATRSSVDVPWVRHKNNPFPTYEENGYYLEDAVWMSQYRDDVNPPSEEVRNNLEAGAYVKLLFRFAAEMADRHDGEVERMWVCVAGLDEDGHYIGSLENDPVHDQVLSCGDPIHFHPLHVMEVLAESA
jgi:hypothetical protein